MKHGFTLIELMVVLFISTIVAIMAFYGINSFGSAQAVDNAQLELISNLRSLQTQVYNGSSGLNVQYILLSNGQKTYIVYNGSNSSPRAVSLPAKVQLVGLSWPLLAICFPNPNLSSYTLATGGTNNCSSCPSGNYFACNTDGLNYTQIGASGPTTIQIQLTNGNVSRYVCIQGNGIIINRIYARPSTGGC